MRLAVAVSGGADSLLSLGLLRAEGHDVVAVHAHFLPPDQKRQEMAASLAAQCDRLGVPFAAFDLSGEFRARVIEPFIAAYVAGKTPNPCAACNRHLKFGLLLEKTRDLGAERLATGHYARLETSPDGPALFRGADDTRDQSYFLSLVPREALSQAVFPMADRKKSDNAATLAALGLTPPLPKESREVCFVPDDDYRTFLEGSGAPLSGPGPILLADGTRLGNHLGLWRFTIGQRRGLGIAWREPLYVLAKDAAANALVVGAKAELAASSCRTAPANVLVPVADWPGQVMVQTCYRMLPRPATAALDESGRLSLVFGEPLPRPTPGQTAVLYDPAGRVLAGAEIEDTGLVFPAYLG